MITSEKIDISDLSPNVVNRALTLGIYSTNAKEWIQELLKNASNVYTITLVNNNPGYGTISGGGIYKENEKITIKATPNSGYRFVKWSDGNTNSSRTITVTKNATYYATFEPKY